MFVFTTAVAILLGIAARLEVVGLRWLFGIFAAYALLYTFVLAPWLIREWLGYRKTVRKLRHQRKTLEHDTEIRLDEHREDKTSA